MHCSFFLCIVSSFKEFPLQYGSVLKYGLCMINVAVQQKCTIYFGVVKMLSCCIYFKAYILSICVFLNHL